MKLKKIWDISVFVVSNVLVNSLYFCLPGTTCCGCCTFWLNKQMQIQICHCIAWSILTIVWICCPFMMHLYIMCFDRSCFDGSCNFKLGLKKRLVTSALVILIKNTYNAYRLYKIKYEDTISTNSLTQIEAIKMESGKLALMQAFLVRFIHRNLKMSICFRNQGHNSSSNSTSSCPLAT